MKNWLAIVCAFRKEETDLQATTDSAIKSAGKGAQIITVEDRDATGPGWNRHRGIEAAKDAEAVIVIDAHMRFQGDVLRRMGKQVASKGGLLVPFCHHNAECSFDAMTATGRHYYGGARMVYRAQDGTQKTALAAKWNHVAKSGPTGAVMGACYAFRRDWYYKAGQPLSILRGWGCDEELLSIAAWLSGEQPAVIDGHVAHLYRASAPWKITPAEIAAVGINRASMVSVLATDVSDRRELLAWQGGGTLFQTPEIERLRQAVLSMPRKWREWRAKVCEPDEINGAQRWPRKAHDAAPARQPARPTPVTSMQGVVCAHCKTVHDPLKLEVTNTYPNGNRRHKCPACGNPFVSMFRATP